MRTSLKSARISILETPNFKSYLVQEAKKEGVSISELVRKRCEEGSKAGQDQEEAEVLAAMVKELQAAVVKDSASIDKGLKDTTNFLDELRVRRPSQEDVLGPNVYR